MEARRYSPRSESAAEQQERLRGDLVAELLRVRHVVAADADDLRRFHGRQQRALVEGDSGAIRSVTAPRRRPEDDVLIAIGSNELDIFPMRSWANRMTDD